MATTWRSPTISHTTTSAADERLRRLLMRIDDHIDMSGLAREVLPADTPARLRSEETDHAAPRPARWHRRSVIWATGYRRAYPWLRVPVLDSERRDQCSGAASPPIAGLYVVGQRHQHRRDSNFIDGVRYDASFVARHIAGRVGRDQAAASLSHEEAS